MKIQKKLKMTLAIFMALVLLVASLPVVASAEGAVCKIGTATYNSLSEAVAAAEDGDVIDVIADNTVSSKSSIVGKTIEITSSNASKITITVNDAISVGSGTEVADTPGGLVLSGNLKVYANCDFAFPVLAGSFTMKDNVAMEAADGKRYIIDGYEDKVQPVHITIEGGSIKTNTTAEDKGSIFIGARNSTFTMTGGTITQESDVAYALKATGENLKINISGGYIKGVDKTVLIYQKYQGKELNFTGGTIEATGKYPIQMHSNCDNLTVNISDNAVLKANTSTIKVSSPMSTVNVSGGTIIAKEDMAIDMRYGALNVTGGKFILEGNKTDAVLVKTAFDEDMLTCGTVTINGGFFINKNSVNASVMDDSTEDTDPIEFNGGTVLYKANVTDIINGRLDATKTNEAIYDDETYYVYNRFAGAEKKLAGAMVDGATIRFAENSNGLRFAATFSSSVTGELAKKGTVSYGMIIVPVEYLTTLDEVSVDALVDRYGASGVLNIACTESKGLVKNSDGSVVLQAAIVNIKSENYDTVFAAIAYASVGGEYYYTAFDQTLNAASVKDVAAAALADTEATYTDAEMTVLNGFAA